MACFLHAGQCQYAAGHFVAAGHRLIPYCGALIFPVSRLEVEKTGVVQMSIDSAPRIAVQWPADDHRPGVINLKVQARTRRTKVNAHEPVVSREEIARRAYEIWQSRGCPSSDGTDEWQAAEAELTAARVARNGSTQERVQSWWNRVLKKGKRQESQ
jgi:hypothetical protein